HIVTPAGILPNPEKIKSVLRVKPLKDASEVRAFLGFPSIRTRFLQARCTLDELTNCRTIHMVDRM
ncbi:hypothetical protein AeMF1_005846, partial [Aphanomyces euteiches]